MGRAWKFGSNIDTDAIIGGKYLVINEPSELAKHVFENLRPEFAENVGSGDFVVADENFGCGSSREHAPIALKASGIEAVIAKSYARIFFRNAINIGLKVVECQDADKIEDGDDLEIDYDRGILIDKAKNVDYNIKKFPNFLQRIIEKGGLVGFGKELYTSR
ncbi:MAG: 3-isopropylmalate dehydratase small subunit [Archaeoglobaceae archaeon]